MSVSPRPPTLLQLPSYLAGNVARIGHRALSASLAEEGLRLSHYAALTALSDFGPLVQGELADRLAVDRAHMVGHLDDLERLGLVARTRDPEDRRRMIVTLTAEGAARLPSLHAAAQRSQRDLLDVLSNRERQSLVDLLARVLAEHDRLRQGAPSAPR